MMDLQTFCQFIRFAIDDNCHCPNIENLDWEKLYRLCLKQAIAGVGFQGIEKLRRKEAGIPKQLMLKWFSINERIQRRNKIVNERCVQLVKMLEEDGFNCCILKGQGNALMYPNPFRRAAGDIDIFVKPKERMSLDKRRKKIKAYVRKRTPKTYINYKHIEYPIFDDVEVEMHFIPVSRNNPLYNKRIQTWAEQQMDTMCSHFVELPENVGKIPVPTMEFNVIYQLSHMMGHFFDEGIGLRQMMDYYYLLKNQELRIDKTQIEKLLDCLGMQQFAGAAMFVLQKVFGLKEQYFIVPADEYRGKTLLHEILKGGNFGQSSGLRQHHIGIKYYLKTLRNILFAKQYPSEALCEPAFRTWHFFWRQWNKLV